MRCAAVLLAACGAFGQAPAVAQTLTTGAIRGSVVTEAGVALPRVSVTVTSAAMGLERHVTSDRAGAFTVPYLEPGEYSVFAEQVGYRPRRITGVPVQAGGRTAVAVRLAQASGPVTSVDEEPYGAGSPGGSMSGAGRWVSRPMIETLPAAERTLDHVLNLTTLGDPDSGIEGLPIGMSTLAMDGVPFRRALHPGWTGEGLALTPFPLLQLAGASVEPNPLEVEAAELSGSWLGVSGLAGGNAFHAQGFARLSPAALASSGDFTTSDADAGTSYAVGGVLSGAVVKDSARLVVGFEARRSETPFLRAWPQIPGAANAGAFAAPRTLTRQAATGFAGFEWQISENNHVSLRGDVAFYPEYDLAMLDVPSITLRPRVSGRDISAGGSVRTLFADAWVNELRAGFGTSRREYRMDADIPLTRLAQSGAGFGTDPLFPGDFQQTRLDVSDALTYATSDNAFKVGGTVSTTSYDRTYLYGTAGEYRFGGPVQLTLGDGAYYEAVGAAPSASFNAPSFGAFAQDRWSAAPGLDVIAGMRFDVEKLPQSDVVTDPLWAGLTGILNSAVPTSLATLSPRLGFHWDVEQRHEWVVSGGAGLYGDRVDPGVLAALIRDHGSIDIRRGVGLLGVWPERPSDAAAPVVGSSLSLMSSDFKAPQTLRASIGVDRALGSAASLHLAATYRRTENLPRVDDLNLLREPSSHDQYGRPIFGELVKQGALISARPRTSRRFEQYDAVTTFTSDGTSRYGAFSVGLDVQPTSATRLFARYTYSKTTDDWLAAGRDVLEYGLDPLAVAAGGSVGPVAGDWADGRSNFDVPSRFAVGGVSSATAGVVSLRLSGLYTWRSGRSFTPGFPAGVDLNGDGSGLNDPAYVDASVSGIDPLLSDWSCLRSQVGRIAERNACRGPGRSALDLRVSAGLLGDRNADLRLFVDAVHLVRTGDDLLDPALYTVDAVAPLVTDGGTVTIPLVGNPNFGKALVRNVYPRVIRIGLEVSY